MTATIASTTTEHRPTPPYDELAAVLRGPIIRPGEPPYEQPRVVYNAIRSPGAVARCVDVADVIECVRFAGKHGIGLAVRGGGHNARGLGAGDEALVIEVSSMRRWSVPDLIDTDLAWRVGYLPES